MGVFRPPYTQRAGAASVYVLAEDGSTQIALFTYASNQTTIEGSGVTNEDLILKANSVDARSIIEIFGGGDIRNSCNTGSSILWREYVTQSMKLTYGTNESTLEFGSTTGDDGIIKANSTDNYPYIQLLGNSGAKIEIKSASSFAIYEETVLKMIYDSNNENLNIGAVAVSSNYDLALLKDGVLCMKETTTPTADTNYGKIYTKNDNNLYFQDGAGNEHQIAYA